MSPSALTRSIQRLEEELGQPLFQRSKRSVALTRAGEIFRDHARAQLAAHARLLEALAAEAQAPTGELRIACTVTACHSVLAQAARALSRSLPRHPPAAQHLGRRALHAGASRTTRSTWPWSPSPTARPRELRFVRLAHTELSFIAPALRQGARAARAARAAATGTACP